MVPERHRRRATQDAREDVGHSHGEARRAPRAREHRRLPDGRREGVQLGGRDRESPVLDRLRGAGRGGAQSADGRVDGEVDPRRERARRDEGHHRDE